MIDKITNKVGNVYRGVYTKIAPVNTFYISIIK